MTNLKINGVPTPYWCVVVPIDYDAKLINEIDKLVFELLGCITLSSMDEGVREVVDEKEWLYDPYVDSENEVKCYRDFVDGNKWWQDAHESALSLLQHNQLTLTAATKAVVVKKIS